MEKIPAACAMEWSIELEKSLRSKKPGKSIEAIQEIRSKLEWWNSEPKLTMAEYHFFGLIPGEDRLYINAILLRLVDTFCSGDKDIKLCIAKVFMSKYKHRKKRRNTDGILLKDRVPNYLEVLRRVKVVFETGDVEVRSMCLALFGCWANFAHDRAEIRYLILSSVVSSDVLEVKASLFAAGCFCELSDDFACVVLEILVNMVSSSDISKDIRIAGVRSLAKLGGSYTIATKAYETGLKLFSDSSEEDLSVFMMISLSKIASKSTLLTSTQVKMLFSFLSQDKSFCLQATSLKCLRFILAGGAHSVHASGGATKTLLCRLNEPKIPPALQCDALQILHKILLQNMFSFSYPDMHELLSELLTIAEDGNQFSTSSNRVLSFYVLVDIYGKFMGRSDSEVDGEELHHLASQMITSIVYRIFLLVKEVLELHLVESQAEQEVKSLLNLLIHLVQARMVLAGLVLEKILNSVKFMSKGKTVLSGLGSELGESKRDIATKLMLYICKVLVYCIENVDKTGVLTTEVHIPVKLLVEDAHRPPISSQLFTSNRDAIHGDGLSVCRGSHLSLNLCLQLRNMPEDLQSRLPKLYCVLSTSASYCPIRGETKQAELGFQDWRTDDMIDMNKKLFQYVMRHKSKTTLHLNEDSGDRRNLEDLVCFETNVKGQGFSTCLLDVSAFPLGSYRIKWHSCCIDSRGSYWSLLPLNPGPIFTVQ